MRIRGRDMASLRTARTILFFLLSFLLGWNGNSVRSLAQDFVFADDVASLDNSSMPNLRMQTLGGKQFWTDHVWRYQWRIQKNAVTGHFRLLDPANVRHAWGSQEHCQEELDRLNLLSTQIPPDRVVLFAHGLMRTSGSLAGLAKRVQSETGATPILFEYASSRSSIGDHAAALRELIEKLPVGVDGKGPRIDFVAHSMGNIVIRRAIGDWQRGPDPSQALSRLGRMVMLGPPNQGATIAKKLAKTGIFGVVTGQGGIELGSEWNELERTLATPPFPFAVVAGNLEANRFQNPLVEGASDFVVGVEEAKLQGMSDFVEVPVLHSFLMDDPSVQQSVVRFLETGKLRVPPNEAP